MRTEVPLYETLQETVAGETEALEVTTILDLGSGTGETLGPGSGTAPDGAELLESTRTTV